MKPAKIVLLFLIVSGCTNTVDFTQEDAERQPWLASFTRGFEFTDGIHNLSDGIIKVNLITEDNNGYFIHTDSVAREDGWMKCYSTQDSRVYVKNIPFQEEGEDIVIIKASNIRSGSVTSSVSG